jgi:hypothetical protein
VAPNGFRPSGTSRRQEADASATYGADHVHRVGFAALTRPTQQTALGRTQRITAQRLFSNFTGFHFGQCVGNALVTWRSASSARLIESSWNSRWYDLAGNAAFAALARCPDEDARIIWLAMWYPSGGDCVNTSWDGWRNTSRQS